MSFDVLARATVEAIQVATEPLHKRIQQLEAQIATLSGTVGPIGPPGAPGVDGKDGAEGAIGPVGPPGERGTDGRHGIDGKDGTNGADGIGKDGAPGRDGRDGLAGIGERGADGKDGKDGINGTNGLDGLGFDDLDVRYDGERSFTFHFAQGSRVKDFTYTVPVMLFRDVFDDTKSYTIGDVVQFGGNLYLAKTDGTTTKPTEMGDGIKEWRLVVRRGRDGKQGPPGADGKPGKDGGPK